MEMVTLTAKATVVMVVVVVAMEMMINTQIPFQQQQFITNSPRELNFVKKVGDLTLHSGNRTPIKKNGMLCCLSQTLKKLDLSAVVEVFVVGWPPRGQSTENKENRE